MSNIDFIRLLAITFHNEIILYNLDLHSWKELETTLVPEEDSRIMSST